MQQVIYLVAVLFISHSVYVKGSGSPNTQCQQVERDCLAHYLNGCREDGVYTIDPTETGHEMKAYCDMTYNGGGWTVIQRRVDGRVNFFRGWDEYARGFGNLTGNMWLGLEKINMLTENDDISELYIYLESFENEYRFAKFSHFYIEDSRSRFRIHVSGYYGTAGDGLSQHNNYRFSTFDLDNDVNAGNCANTFSGAWWYKKCHNSNLNGLYLSGKHKSYANGVNYSPWKGNHYSLKTTVMKVRRHSQLVAPSHVA